jgi:hypothetical protein
MFRNSNRQDPEADRIPSLFGDGIDFESSPRYQMSVTHTQYRLLEQWAEGDFQSDLPNGFDPLNPPLPRELEDCPLAEQPGLLDRAALDACMGGPFHPGIEATWIMRRPSLYSAPFRLRVKSSPQEPPQDFGEVLTPDVALALDGPLSAGDPGDLTRWMAVPWQSDAASCGAPEETPLPTWWPARVPNHVMSEAVYRRIVDTAGTPEDRVALFKVRQDWLRHLRPRYRDRIIDMVTLWPDIGIIEERPGAADASNLGLPPRLYAETGSRFERGSGDEANREAAFSAEAPQPAADVSGGEHAALRAGEVAPADELRTHPKIWSLSR